MKEERLYKLAHEMLLMKWSKEKDFLEKHPNNEISKSRENKLWNELLELEKGLKIDSVGADITGDVSIKGQSNLTGTLTVSENGSFKKDLEVTSVTTTNDIVINNNLKSKTGEFTSNLNVDNNLYIAFFQTSTD